MQTDDIPPVKPVINKSYPFVHWLSTMLLGPFFMMMYDASGSSSGDFMGYVFIIMAFGLAFSVPVLIVYALLFYILAASALSAMVVKGVLNLVAIAGIFVIMQALTDSMAGDGIAVPYAVAVVLCSFLFPVYKKKAEEPGEEVLSESENPPAEPLP